MILSSADVAFRKEMLTRPTVRSDCSQSICNLRYFQFHLILVSGADFGSECTCSGPRIKDRFQSLINQIKVKVCKDLELKQSEPKSNPQNQNGK